MNWLTEFVRPKLRQLVRRETPDNLWHQCPSCSQMIFHRELEKSMRVCPHCDHHMRLDAKQRLALLFDDGRYALVESPAVPLDPLRFRDSKRYTDRLKEAQGKSGAQDAVLIGHGQLGGAPAVVAAFDFNFMGGSMGLAVGEAIIAAARLAVAKRTPFIVVPASGGARMQEGILSLMQMPRTTVAVAEVKEAGLPYIVILADPTTGGVSASFAMLGDIAIAEPGAAIGFAGQRVIRETIRETLPEGFQRAEYLHEHGMIDMVVHRHELRQTLARMLGLLTRPLVPASGADAVPDAIEPLLLEDAADEADVAERPKAAE